MSKNIYVILINSNLFGYELDNALLCQHHDEFRLHYRNQRQRLQDADSEDTLYSKTMNSWKNYPQSNLHYHLQYLNYPQSSSRHRCSNLHLSIHHHLQRTHHHQFIYYAISDDLEDLSIMIDYCSH
jgi:hypothetical protein